MRISCSTCAACRIRYWEPGLARLTGRDAAVVEYLERHPNVAKMFDDIVGFLEQWIPELVRTNRSYLTIAIGCTGGQHRSVYLVERLAQHFSAKYPQVHARHQVVGASNRPLIDRRRLVDGTFAERVRNSSSSLAAPLHCARNLQLIESRDDRSHRSRRPPDSPRCAARSSRAPCAMGSA